MAFETRQYLIFETHEIHKVDFSKVLETSTETLRRSVDGTKTFVKWDGSTPNFVGDLETGQGPYNHQEILQILSGTEWSEPVEDESGTGS